MKSGGGGVVKLHSCTIPSVCTIDRCCVSNHLVELTVPLIHLKAWPFQAWVLCLCYCATFPLLVSSELYRPIIWSARKYTGCSVYSTGSWWWRPFTNFLSESRFKTPNIQIKTKNGWRFVFFCSSSGWSLSLLKTTWLLRVKLFWDLQWSSGAIVSLQPDKTSTCWQRCSRRRNAEEHSVCFQVPSNSACGFFLWRRLSVVPLIMDGTFYPETKEVWSPVNHNETQNNPENPKSLFLWSTFYS